MHRKTHVVTTTVLGGLLMAVPSFAQTVREAAHDSAHAVRSGTERAGHAAGEAARDTRDAVRGTPDHDRDIHMNTQTQGTTASTTSGTNCPAGCVAARHYTPEQVASMRRAREERRERLAREQAERDQQRQDLENCRTRSQQLEAEAQQLRADGERSRTASLEEDRAAMDRKRAEAERLARIGQQQQNRGTYYAPQGWVAPRARGGGPNFDRGTHLQFGAEGGVGGFTGPAHNLAWVGPTWGARVGVHFMNWLGVEARYFGMYNDGYDPRTGPNVGVLTHETTGVVRLMIPTPYVRPYALGGFGVAWNNVASTNSADRQATVLRENRSGVVPMGGGIDVPIGRRWGVGFEGVYHYYLNQNFSADANRQGGQWHTGMNVHVSL